MKRMKLLSLAMLTTILTACSSGSGSGSMGDPNSSSFAASGEKRVALPAPNTVIVDLNSSTALQSLYEAAKKKENLSGSCSNASGKPCDKTYPVGTLLGAYNQSYSTYAVVRATEYVDADEDGSNDDDSKPANAFYAFVSQPTTDRSTIVDATYTGSVSYSSKNRATVVTKKDLTMTVSGNTISGSIVDTAGSGKQRTRMTFESAEIVASPTQISFNGDVTFNREVFLETSTSNPEYEGDIKGTYQGMFAGASGQEVVGTFHSNNLIKEYSIQGAFAATRQ